MYYHKFRLFTIFIYPIYWGTVFTHRAGCRAVAWSPVAAHNALQVQLHHTTKSNIRGRRRGSVMGRQFVKLPWVELWRGKESVQLVSAHDGCVSGWRRRVLPPIYLPLAAAVLECTPPPAPLSHTAISRRTTIADISSPSTCRLYLRCIVSGFQNRLHRYAK